MAPDKRSSSGSEEAREHAHAGKYRLVSYATGRFELRWETRGRMRRHKLGRVSEAHARNCLDTCAHDPAKPPKDLLRASVRLEESAGLWLERRMESGTIYLGWYDEVARQTRHVSLRTMDVATAKQMLFRCADRLPEDPRVALERSRSRTVSDVLDAYYIGHAGTLPSAEQARIAIGLLKPLVGALRSEAISFDASKTAALALIARGHSVSYVSRTLSVLRAAFHYGRKLQLVRASPLFYEPRTAAHMEAEPLKGDPLDLDQVAKLADEASEPHALVGMVGLLNTAARISCLLELRGCQIDREFGLLRLNPPGRIQTKKRRPILRIPETFMPWIEHLADDELYVTYRGEPVKSMKVAFRGMRSRAGLPANVNSYSVRHTLGRWMERQRVSDKQISMVLGHMPTSVKRTTLRYTVSPESPEYLREATAAIEEFVREVARRTHKVDILNPPWRGKAIREISKSEQTIME